MALLYPENVLTEEYNSYITIIPKRWTVDEEARPKKPQGKLGTVAGEQITLYMPNQIEKEHNINWQGEELGLASNISDPEKMLQETKAKGIDTLKASLGSMTNLNTQTASRASQGYANNPHVRMLFQSIDYRTFSFSFELTPRTEKEAETVIKIMNEMERNSLPSIDSEKGRFNFPNYFWLRMKTKTEEQLSAESYVDVMKFQPCVVTNLSFNLTPQSVWAQFKNGTAVSVTMDVQFTETSYYTSKSVDNL